MRPPASPGGASNPGPGAQLARGGLRARSCAAERRADIGAADQRRDPQSGCAAGPSRSRGPATTSPWPPAPARSGWPWGTTPKDDHSPESIMRIDPGTGHTAGDIDPRRRSGSRGRSGRRVGHESLLADGHADPRQRRPRDARRVGEGPRASPSARARCGSPRLRRRDHADQPAHPADAPHRDPGDPRARHGRRRLGLGDRAGSRAPDPHRRQHARGARAHRHRPAAVRAGHHARARGG